MTDDNGTPDLPGDDFQPTYTGGDTNSNNLLDPGEMWTYSATKYPILTLGQPVNGVFTELATMALEELPGGDLRAIFTLSRDINDNAYGTGAVPAGWSSHKFGDLTGSDRAQFAFLNANGTVVWQADVDYISASGTFPSGYGTLGVTGGEGDMIIGNAAHLLAVTTSLTENLNNPPWLGNPSVLVNSPAEPNPTWEYHIVHDLTIDNAAFGASGFGSVQVIEMHNSPSKNGYNLVEPTVVHKSVTNLATVVGTVNGSPVSDSDTETVHVGAGDLDAKFYVVDGDDADGNPIYRYDPNGVSGTTTPADGKDPRGIASFPDRSRLLVVDKNDKVFAYDPDGTLVGSWTAGNLDEAQGISTDGTNVWILDGKQRRVLRYDGAASLTTGSATPNGSFNLNSGNDKPTDLVTDGTKIWVVDGDDKYVFVYTMNGSYLGSWLPQGASKPRGITLDPTNVGTIWLVDTGNKSVLRYDNATNVTGGTVALSGQFPLTADNADPQGIADPPVFSSRSGSVTTQAASQDPEVGLVASSIQPVVVPLESPRRTENLPSAAVQAGSLRHTANAQRWMSADREADSRHANRPAAFLRHLPARRLAALVDRAFGEFSQGAGKSTDEVFAELASDLREDAFLDALLSRL